MDIHTRFIYILSMSIDNLPNSVRFNRCQGIYNLVLEPQS